MKSCYSRPSKRDGFCWEVMMQTNENKMGKNDHWCTPATVWGPLVDTMGEIALDPFSNPRSKVPAKAKWTDWTEVHEDSWVSPRGERFEGHVEGLVEGDGFQAERWPDASDGLVWVNGPFSENRRWTMTCHVARHSEVVYLARASVNAKWWQATVARADRIFFPDTRVAFEGGTTGYTAPFHVCVAYRGPRPGLFEHAYQSYGCVLRGGSL